MSLEQEYEASLALLEKTAEGQRVRVALSPLAKRLLTLFSGISWLDQETALQLLEKNLILLSARVLLIARNFDALDLGSKLEKLAHLLFVLKEEQKEWFHDFEKKSEHLHEKKERRKRRKEALLHEHFLRVEDRPFAEKALKALLHMLLPQGVDSLFLPPMAKIFLSKNFFEVFLLKHIDRIMDFVHRREWKEALLFRIVAFLFQDVFIKTPFRHSGEFSVPEALLEKLKMLSSWVLSLLANVEPVMQYIPREEAAKLACECIMPFSFEKAILTMLPSFLSDASVGNNLDVLVDSVTGDPKAVLFLLKKVVSLKGPLFDVKAVPTLGSILALSVKSSLVDHALQEKAASLVYHEVPFKVFQNIHLFVLSPFFDRAIYRSFY